MKLNGTEAFTKTSDEKREQVVEAALREFASQGYRGSSMNVIAKAAGVSKGSLFLYFRAKGGLFQAVVDFAAEQARGYLREARAESADQPFCDRLAHLIRSGFNFIDRHPLLARIYFNLLQSNDVPSGARWVADLNAQSRRFLQKMLDEAVQRGQVRADLDVPRVSYLINTLLERLLRSYYTDYLAQDLGLYAASEEERERWIQVTVGLIREGIERKEERGKS